MPNYCWVITQDLDGEDGEEFDGWHVGDCHRASTVGTYGPAAAGTEQVVRALTEGRFFRLADADGEPVAIGRIWAGPLTADADDPGSCLDFAPLDDWGGPSLGASHIEYRAGGEWKAL